MNVFVWIKKGTNRRAWLGGVLSVTVVLALILVCLHCCSEPTEAKVWKGCVVKNSTSNAAVRLEKCEPSVTLYIEGESIRSVSGDDLYGFMHWLHLCVTHQTCPVYATKHCHLLARHKEHRLCLKSQTEILYLSFSGFRLSNEDSLDVIAMLLS